LREFQRFAPSLSTVTYHGNKTARYKLRKVLLENQASTSRIGGGWEILITTYGIAHQGEHDRKFLGKIKWNVRPVDQPYLRLNLKSCKASVFDEGHMLKNLTSKRYTSLIRYSSQWRLLLTGTPIQNNLQEVVVSATTLLCMVQF
jgi:SWI/SNF-related matrix-associated actin-dependent regulator of chromatin subfamily A containing DEAD/H box 1